MNVYLFPYSKKKNSTAQPALNTGTSFNVTLKEDTSVLNPVLVFNAATTGMPAPFTPSYFNYAYIPTFSRYYYVTDWVNINALWECHLTVDPLASFRTGIGASSVYVVRSASNYDGTIFDSEYPAKAETSVQVTPIPSVFRSVYAGGYYIVGIISNNSNDALGAITYYQMTPTQMATLKSYMMSNTFMAEQGLTAASVVSALPNELLKTLYNPFQYIASCEWFPFDISEIPSAFKVLDVNVAFGWWMPSTQIQGYRVNPNGYVKRFTERYPVHSHPSQSRGTFLNHAPYTDRMLYYSPYGSVPINDDSIEAGDYIRVEIDVDLLLGDSVLSVYHDRPSGNAYTNMGLLYRTQTKISVPIQLAQQTTDIENTAYAGLAGSIPGVVNGVSSILNGGNLFSGIGTAIEGVKTGVCDALSMPVGQLSTSGSNGSVAMFSQTSYLVEKFKSITEDANSKKGKPLMQVKTINTLSGYILCGSADVNLSCFDSERTEINNYLNTGFYYE